MRNIMTVAELISILEEYDKDANVLLEAYEESVPLADLYVHNGENYVCIMDYNEWEHNDE